MTAVTIGGTLWPAELTSRCGPFQDGSGNLWVVGFSSGTTSVELLATTSTDGGATWPTAYTTSTSNAFANYFVDCVFDSASEVIYVTALKSSAIVIYTFTIGTHAWAEVYTSGTRPTPSTDVNGNVPAFLTRRSTGEFVVFYQGPTHSLMGTPYRACYYARCSSAGVWSAGVEVSAAVKLSHYDAKSAALGASDRSHFLYGDSASSALVHRSLSSANAFGETPGQQQALGNQGYHAIYYDATLAKVVYGAGTSVASLVARATSGAAPTWTSDTNSVGDVEGNSSNPAFVYEPTGGDLYVFFRDTTSDDVYQNSTATTTWTTANAALQDAATVAGISVGLITNAIGVVFNDAGTVKFDTLEIGTAPPGFSPLLKPTFIYLRKNR